MQPLRKLRKFFIEKHMVNVKQTIIPNALFGFHFGFETSTETPALRRPEEVRSKTET